MGNWRPEIEYMADAGIFSLRTRRGKPLELLSNGKPKPTPGMILGHLSSFAQGLFFNERNS